MVRNRKAALLAAIMLALAGVALGGVGQVAGDHTPDHSSDDDDEEADNEDEGAEDEEEAEDEEAEEEEEPEEAEAEEEEPEDVRIASIDLEEETNTSEERLKARLSVDGDTHFQVRWKHEVEDGEDEVEKKHRLRVDFATLVEYRDADDDGVFDASESANDTVVSSWALGDAVDARFRVDDGGDVAFDDPTVMRKTMDGEEVAAFHANGTLTNDTLAEDPNATVGNVTLAGAVAWDPGAENTTFQPTVAKTAFEVQGFPFVANDTDLAIVLSVETRSKTEAPNVTVEYHMAFHVEVDDTATVDDEETDVGTTILHEEEESKDEEGEVKTEMETDAVLAYQRGDQVNHHPQLVATLD